MVDLLKIKRDEVEDLVVSEWLATMSKQELLNQIYPNFFGMHNYELERILKETFGKEWVVDEYCPYDGKYCKFGEHLSEGV